MDFVSSTPPVNAAEKQVWERVREAFSGRNGIAYLHYPIFGRRGERRKEPDVLILDIELGVVIIEVKSLRAADIQRIEGHDWYVTEQLTPCRPYAQAENQLFALMGWLDVEPITRGRLAGRVLVALPNCSAEEWQARGFHNLPAAPPCLFSNNLSPTRLRRAITETATIRAGVNNDQQAFEAARSILSGAPTLQRREPRDLFSTLTPAQITNRLAAIEAADTHRFNLDLEQQRAGMSIPPGPQRIRGIAGSGKTVLLCQKAAAMRLRFPNWKIGFVFFTRSLYDLVTKTIDRWMRRFSEGEACYDSSDPNLRVMHAWGAYNQPGFLRTMEIAHQQAPTTAEDVRGRSPSEGCAEGCRRLLDRVSNIKPEFDALLLDEAQDLVVDQPLYQGSQPFFTLAWRALRPTDPQQPHSRRLIWAYDEAQSLDTLAIPTARALIADISREHARLFTGQYEGGIPKSIIMHRCYRTPGPILTAAHAIGMGLL